MSKDINENDIFPAKEDGDIVQYHEDMKWYKWNESKNKWEEIDAPNGE